MEKGYMYIVTNDTYESKDLYKVGHTKNTKDRFRNFQTFSPDLLKIIYVHECEDRLELEQQIHAVMEAFDARIRNEWYQLNARQLSAIIGLLNGQVRGRNVTEEVSRSLQNNRHRTVCQTNAATVREMNNLGNLSGTFYLRGQRTAVLTVSDGTFVVKQGALAKKTTSAVLENGTYHRVLDRRAQMLSSGILMDAGEHYVLTRDEEFDNVSMAANVLLGQWSNGRDVWIDGQGRSINDVIKGER